MAITLKELQEKMAGQWDEVTILEALNIDAEMLVERFGDEIEERFTKLCKEFEDENSE